MVDVARMYNFVNYRHKAFSVERMYNSIKTKVLGIQQQQKNNVSPSVRFSTSYKAVAVKRLYNSIKTKSWVQLVKKKVFLLIGSFLFDEGYYANDRRFAGRKIRKIYTSLIFFFDNSFFISVYV